MSPQLLARGWSPVAGMSKASVVPVSQKTMVRWCQMRLRGGGLCIARTGNVSTVHFTGQEAELSMPRCTHSHACGSDEVHTENAYVASCCAYTRGSAHAAGSTDTGEKAMAGPTSNTASPGSLFNTHPVYWMLKREHFDAMTQQTQLSAPRGQC
jgi:hypothetical protein